MLEFRRPKFNSWLDFTYAFCSNSANKVSNNFLWGVVDTYMGKKCADCVSY